MKSHFFTFGTDHMCNHPDQTGPLSDHWVRVTLADDHPESHRDVFVRAFTERYCPRPMQFSFEYTEENFNPGHFPAGELVAFEEGVNRVLTKDELRAKWMAEDEADDARREAQE